MKDDRKTFSQVWAWGSCIKAIAGAGMGWARYPDPATYVTKVSKTWTTVHTTSITGSCSTNRNWLSFSFASLGLRLMEKRRQAADFSFCNLWMEDLFGALCSSPTSISASPNSVKALFPQSPSSSWMQRLLQGKNPNHCSILHGQSQPWGCYSSRSLLQNS